MKTFVLTALTMLAFAANSVLTRAGVVHTSIDVQSFALIRLAAGAAVLLLLCLLTGRRAKLATAARLFGVIGLVLYIVGFTEAYLGMDSGLGALLLFGTVQVTMFAGAVALREPLPMLRVAGAVIAFAGLVYLVWPWQSAADARINIAMMVIAGIGWGVYSMVGRNSADPLADTAANFLLASIVLPLGYIVLDGASMTAEQVFASAPGVWLAVVCGAVTSGLGYALWYTVLPRLGGSVAAVAQLTVPPIAMIGGMVFLAEPLTAKFTWSSIVVLGGVALSVLGPVYFAKSSKGS